VLTGKHVTQVVGLAAVVGLATTSAGAASSGPEQTDTGRSIKATTPCLDTGRLAVDYGPHRENRSRAHITLLNVPVGSEWSLRLAAQHGPSMAPTVMIFDLPNVTADEEGQAAWDASMTWRDRTLLRVKVTDDSGTSCRLALAGRVG
jgi:hypothetical protein